MSSDEREEKECPLCMEPFELDDFNFYPCDCKYQICRFCWHRIRMDENGLCPACRAEYPELPVNFTPLSNEELVKIRTEKRQKQQKEKQKLSESRKHLANIRVLQKNLVYVVGLSSRVADPEILKKQEYFGKYGKIHKVVVVSTTNSGSASCPKSSSSSTAYVTYTRSEDALRAIHSVNNCQLDGRVVRVSLGTTKYCSAFLRNQTCQKPECMYLHDVADEDASFTKEDMQQGKHTEYERKLSEQTFASLNNHITLSTNNHKRSLNGLDEENVSTRRTHHHRSRATVGGSNDRQSSQQYEAPPRHQRGREKNSHSSDAQQRDTGGVHAIDGGKCTSNSEQHQGGDIGKGDDEARSSSSGSQSPQHQPQHRLTHSYGGEPTTRQQTTTTSTNTLEQLRHNCDSDRQQQQFRFASSPELLLERQPPPPQMHHHDDDALRRLLTGTLNGVTAVSGPTIGHRDSPVASAAACEPTVSNGVGPVSTDWQAAFGLLPTMSHGADAELPPSCPSPMTDDDLGFDPFSESSKGLANLLEEEREQMEREKKERQANTFEAFQRQNSRSSNSGSGTSHFGIPPPSVGNAATTGWRKAADSLPSDGFSARHDDRSPLSLPHFTTPPPNLPNHAINHHQQQYNDFLQQKNYQSSGAGFPFHHGTSPDFTNDLRGGFGGPMSQHQQPPLRHGLGGTFHNSHQPRFSGPPPNAAQQQPLPPTTIGGGRSLSPSLHRAPMFGHPPPLSSVVDGSPFDLREWQEGLKALLPNVNVSFAPDLQPPSAAGDRHSQHGAPPNHGMMKHVSSGNWLGSPPRGHGGSTMPPLPPFTHPPPPLSVATNLGAMSLPPLRPSPPDVFGGGIQSTFSINHAHHTNLPPPFTAGNSAAGNPWSVPPAVTPPPGFSPGGGIIR